jgi:hypothetical protein
MPGLTRLAVNPACPKAMMQWQHGSYTQLSNGSLLLQPIEGDGRQLLSDPCRYTSSVYSRFNQSELMQACAEV